MIDLSLLHQQFQTWFASVPAAVQADMHAFFDATATDVNFAQNHPTGLYARQRAVLDYANSQYGYLASAATLQGNDPSKGDQPEPPIAPTTEPIPASSSVPPQGGAGLAKANAARGN